MFLRLVLPGRRFTLRARARRPSGRRTLVSPRRDSALYYRRKYRPPTCGGHEYCSKGGKMSPFFFLSMACGSLCVLILWSLYVFGNWKFILDYTLCDQAKKEDIAVAFLYYDFLAQQEQTTTNMMGAILKQLVGRGIYRGVYERRFRKGKRRLVAEGCDWPI